METLPNNLLPLLTAAADFRAAGKSWAQIADEVNRDPETCRHWPRRYPETWRRLFREAEGQFIAEASIEARAYLRKLLRSKDERIVLGACRLLMQCRHDQIEGEDRTAQAQPDACAPVNFASATLLKNWTAEELHASLDAYLAECAAAQAAAADEPEPSPDPIDQDPFQIAITDMAPPEDEFGRQLALVTQPSADVVLVPQAPAKPTVVYVEVVDAQSQDGERAGDEGPCEACCAEGGETTSGVATDAKEVGERLAEGQPQQGAAAGQGDVPGRPSSDDALRERGREDPGQKARGNGTQARDINP